MSYAPQGVKGFDDDDDDDDELVTACEIVITTRVVILRNYFNIILVRLVQIEVGKLYTEKVNT